MSICVGETNTQDHTLIVAHWKGLLYAAGDVFSVRRRNEEEVLQTPSWREALDRFNALGGTSIPYVFQESWLKWYRSIGKNPLTGTRVGIEHPTYHQYRRDDQAQKVRDYMRTHPEIVAKVKKEHGL